MIKFLSIIIIIAISWSCNKPPSATTNESILTSKVDSLFSDYGALNTPGYAIGISKGQKTLYQKGFGAANLDYNIPIDDNSVFSIASISKQFTAACIALLIIDNEISLETPASNFIPELKKYSDTIRIKHLVYNTSGIRDYHQIDRKDGRSWITFNYFDIDESISSSLSQENLLFKPGTQWDYSNANFMLLTKIVEKISGTSFSNFAHERLFVPLKMNNSIINDDMTTIVKNRVTPYNIRNEEYLNAYKDQGINLKSEGDFIRHPRNSPHYGGSGVMSTIEDLLIWSKNMVSKEFGGQEFYDMMHHTPTFEHDRNNQAFGLYIGDFNGREIVAWEGGDYGISSQLLRFPEEEIAIVVLSNLGSGESFRKVNQIGEVLMNLEIIK